MRDLFDKYYEHPVDRIHEVGQTSGFHRREKFGEINIQNERVEEVKKDLDSETTVPKKGSIKEKLLNLFYQQFSFLYLLVGTAWIILMIVYYTEVHQQLYQDGNFQIPQNQQVVNLNIQQSQLEIVDYHSESISHQPYILEYNCYSDSYDSDDKTSTLQNCIITLYINWSYLYNHKPLEQINISCLGQDKCQIHIKSNHLIAEKISFIGYNLHVRALQITAQEFRYDSYLGSIQIKHLNAQTSWINTNRGNIVIQTTKNLLFSSYTVDKLVCVTSPLALKIVSPDNSYVQIQNFEKFFETLSEDECLHPKEIKEEGQTFNFKKELKHNKGQAHKYQNHFHSFEYGDDKYNQKRCIALRNILLANHDFEQNPNNLQQMFVTNAEGNIFINVLNSNGTFAEQVYNPVYSKDNFVQFSNSTQDFLIENLKDKKIQDLSKIIVNLNFDDRRGLFHDNNKIIYRFLSPWWISTLTFDTLNFYILEHDLILTPSVCPYYLSDTSYLNQTDYIDNLVVEKLSSFIQMLDLHDASFRLNGKYVDENETTQTVFIVCGILILISCAIGTVMLHMYFYRKVEIDRNSLKRKAFEMWIFISMNLFDKKQYNKFDHIYKQMFDQYNRYFSTGQQQQQFQTAQFGQQSQQSSQQMLVISYFDQMLGILNRLLDSSIKLNQYEITNEQRQFDISPLISSLLSHPLNFLMKHNSSNFMQLEIRYCILCGDQNIISEFERLFQNIDGVLKNNQNQFNENQIINYLNRIQQLINQETPSQAQVPFNITPEMRNNMTLCQEKLRFLLLNQSMFFLKNYIDSYQNDHTWILKRQANLLSLDANLQNQMLDQLSQLYIRCKNNCPEIFEKIANNDQSKVKIYMETLNDTMKKYNVYTRTANQLETIESNFLVKSLSLNINCIVQVFEHIIQSSQRSNFIDNLSQLWSYLSSLQIVENQSNLLLKQQQQSAQGISQKDNIYGQSSQYNASNNIQQSGVSQNMNRFGEDSTVSVTDRFGQDKVEPKSIQIVQKYDYYPTFSNMINVIQCLVKTSKSTIECYCELLFAWVPQVDPKSNIRPNQIEYCDDITIDKFKEYYSVYCYALNCTEEVVEHSKQLDDILQKYMYAVDGDYIRAFSATGNYKVYRGLMEYLFYAVNMAPKKNHEVLLDKEFSKSIARYRYYLLKHSYKINKINAFTIFETILQYIFVFFLLNIPFILCMPIIFAQSSYSHAYFQAKYAGYIYYSRNFDHFVTIFCSSGLPITVQMITFTFIFICAIDTLVYFVKPRLDKFNFYISYFKVIFPDVQPQQIQNRVITNQQSVYVVDDQRYSNRGLDMSQQHLSQSRLQYNQQNDGRSNLQDIDGQKIPRDRYSNRTTSFYIKLTYQIMFQVLLWSLVGFNTFFFLITLMILTISSFVYLEQGLLVAIFLLTLFGVLFLRQRQFYFLMYFKIQFNKTVQLYENKSKTSKYCNLMVIEFYFSTLFRIQINMVIYFINNNCDILIKIIQNDYFNRNLRETHKKTKLHLKESWERLLVCEITQQYGDNFSLSPQQIENFMRDKNLDDKYYRRNKIIAYVKANSYYNEETGSIYFNELPEKMVVGQSQFKCAIRYLIDQGVYLCLKQLKISTSDIVIELTQQAVIQFIVFILCSLFVDYFNLCKTGVQLLFNAIVTIVISILIFTTLDKKHSYITAQTLDNSVNYVSRVQCKAGLTIFTQNVGCNYSYSIQSIYQYLMITIIKQMLKLLLL